MDKLLDTLQFLPLRLSANPIGYGIDAVSPDLVADRSKLLYNLTLKKPLAYGSGVFVDIITLRGRETPKRSELGADVYPGAQFDVGIYLDDSLKRTPPTPNQTGIVTCGDMISPFLVSTSVKNNDVLVAGTDKTLAIEYVMKGALSVEQSAGWRDAFFTVALSQSRQFLTWQPTEKWVDVAQPEFLYYLVNCLPKPQELRLRVDIYYQDGTYDAMTAQRMTTVSQYTAYSIPVGFTALGLPAREASQGKLVHSYKLWLSNESNQRVSEVRTYYVSRDYHANLLYLVFANSLGGYDTLRCTGQTARSLTVRGTDVQRSLPPNYLPTTAELLKLGRSGERTITVATGLRDGDSLDYLSEIMLSEEVYVVTQEGFVALTLPTSGDSTLSLRQDDEDLAGRLLTFRFAKNEVAYSNLPSAPTLPSRPTRWVPTANFCIINDNGIRTGYLGAARLELRYADDNTLVKPLRSKANTPGTEGYVPPVLASQCNSTPFTNALISQSGSFKRSNCGADQEATVATLTIPAGMYGGETADQLASRVSTALATMDTQAYADVNGSCLLNPALYSYSGPANTWHFRTSQPNRNTIYYSGAPAMGDSWNVQGQGGSYIYPQFSRDMDFPIGGDMPGWLIFVYGTAGKQVRVRVWVNGAVIRDLTLTMNGDGYELTYLVATDYNAPIYTLAAGDRIYVQLTDV
jgi:hypothetical protein